MTATEQRAHQATAQAKEAAQRADHAAAQILETQDKLNAAEARSQALVDRVQAAEERATAAEERAKAAEAQATFTEERAKAAEAQAAENEAKADLAATETSSALAAQQAHEAKVAEALAKAIKPTRAKRPCYALKPPTSVPTRRKPISGVYRTSHPSGRATQSNLAEATGWHAPRPQKKQQSFHASPKKPLQTARPLCFRLRASGGATSKPISPRRNR